MQRSLICSPHIKNITNQSNTQRRLLLWRVSRRRRLGRLGVLAGACVCFFSSSSARRRWRQSGPVVRALATRFLAPRLKFKGNDSLSTSSASKHSLDLPSPCGPRCRCPGPAGTSLRCRRRGGTAVRTARACSSSRPSPPCRSRSIRSRAGSAGCTSRRGSPPCSPRTSADPTPRSPPSATRRAAPGSVSKFKKSKQTFCTLRV